MQKTNLNFSFWTTEISVIFLHLYLVLASRQGSITCTCNTCRTAVQAAAHELKTHTKKINNAYFHSASLIEFRHIKIFMSIKLLKKRWQLDRYLEFNTLTKVHSTDLKIIWFCQRFSREETIIYRVIFVQKMLHPMYYIFNPCTPVYHCIPKYRSSEVN